MCIYSIRVLDVIVNRNGRYEKWVLLQESMRRRRVADGGLAALVSNEQILLAD